MTRILACTFRVPPSAFRLPDERHGGEPAYPGAAHELQQERLDLVILVLGEDDEIRLLTAEYRVARGPRSGGGRP